MVIVFLVSFLVWNMESRALSVRVKHGGLHAQLLSIHQAGHCTTRITYPSFNFTNICTTAPCWPAERCKQSYRVYLRDTIHHVHVF